MCLHELRSHSHFTKHTRQSIFTVSYFKLCYKNTFLSSAKRENNPSLFMNNQIQRWFLFFHIVNKPKIRKKRDQKSSQLMKPYTYPYFLFLILEKHVSQMAEMIKTKDVDFQYVLPIYEKIPSNTWHSCHTTSAIK